MPQTKTQILDALDANRAARRALIDRIYSAPEAELTDIEAEVSALEDQNAALTRALFDAPKTRRKRTR